MLHNYHTHTVRCNHAVGTERDYIEAALAAGLKTLGFSDHTPQLFDGGYVSGFRMLPEELDGYCRTMLALRKEYHGRLALPIGLEAEYYPRYFARLSRFLRDYPVDYLILGQHALFNEIEHVFSGAPTTDERILDRYVGQCIEGLETGLFSCLCHPELLRFVGEDKIYDRHMRRLCVRTRELGIPLELNLLGLREPVDPADAPRLEVSQIDTKDDTILTPIRYLEEQ